MSTSIAPVREFASMPRPAHTPWGTADYAYQVAPGIWEVSTPSHGGYIISRERHAAMPAVLRDFRPFATPLCYEEDCDWSIVALAYPTEVANSFKEKGATEIKAIALRTVQMSLGFKGLSLPSRQSLQAIYDWAMQS